MSTLSIKVPNQKMPGDDGKLQDAKAFFRFSNWLDLTTQIGNSPISLYVDAGFGIIESSASGYLRNRITSVPIRTSDGKRRAHPTNIDFSFGSNYNKTATNTMRVVLTLTSFTLGPGETAIVNDVEIDGVESDLIPPGLKQANTNS